MKESWRNHTVQVFEALTSTNDSILQAGETEAPQGTTHIARSQTRGRGRGDHAWWSPPGAGLWMSVLLRPTRDRDSWGALSIVAGSAVRRALVEMGVPGVELHWPNDLHVGPRKIGGILGEVRARGEHAWMALGIGINIDFSSPAVSGSMPEDLRGRVTSMVESGRPSTTEPLAMARIILDLLWPLYERFEAGEEISSIVEEDLRRVGRRVTVKTGANPPWQGIIEGLGPRGELLVRAIPPSSSGVVAVTTGEVTYEE